MTTLAGKIIAHYRILEKIGRGGLGEVFLAEDTVLKRHVAVKFLSTDENAREQTLAEARSAASVDHPYVCKVFEIGECEGKPFIVMEFLEGQTLTQHLKSGPVAVQPALTLAIEISEALAEAHRRGVIHCDLKPSNVMITRNGHVKLMDFGVARAFHVMTPDSHDRERMITGQSPVAGTLAYMAPEQIRAATLDPRADVFALGIVIFEMLAGFHPFHRNTPPATAAAILHEEPPDIRRYLSPEYAAIGEVLNRALAKNSAQRYASATEVASELAVIRDRGTIARIAKAPGIAILPFKDLSPQRDQEWFCEGLAEELILALGSIKQMRVVSRSASFRYANADTGLKEIGQALQVATILEGSVRKSADRLRIIVNLVDVETGSPIWSERYDRQLIDVFEVQDDISRSVAGRLRGTFEASDASRLLQPNNHNIRAYEMYLKGRYFWNRRTPEDLRLSIEQFQRALAEDRDYALAHAGLADAYVTLCLYGAVRPVDVMPVAGLAATRALELHPSLAEAMTSRACIRAIYDWEWDLAARDFRDIILEHPHYAQARQWFAMNCLAPRGQFAPAREQLQMAAELEPTSLAITTSLAVLDFFDRDYDAAISRIRGILRTHGAFYLGHYFLGQAYSQIGMHAEALRELESAVALSHRSSESLGALGHARAIAGEHRGAITVLQELISRNETLYVSPLLIALVQTGLEQHDAAIAKVEEAFRIRSTDLIWLDVRPAFETLRSHQIASDILLNVGLRRPPTGVTEILGSSDS